MNRKEFLQLCGAIIGGLAVRDMLGPGANAQPRAGRGELAERDRDYYLVKGLTGMARATAWFDAHWGAAVIAGHYLCHESELPEQTTAAITKQLDGMIRLREDQFASFPMESADETLIGQLPRALAPALDGGLRAHGHAVIFTALALRALRDVPHLAQPKLIEGLCTLSRQIARIKPQQPKDHTPYTSTQAMIDATFDSLVRFKDLLGRSSVPRPNFTHMTTHTEALMTLESIGYVDLVSAGHAGHRAHISAPVPRLEPASQPEDHQPATLDNLLSPGFWENEVNLTRWNRAWNENANPNGYWVAFGHLFKVLYSFHRLIDRIEDKEKVRLCSMILLERYVNPAVRGG